MTVKKTPSSHELALMVIAREDTAALLARIETKRKAIEDLLLRISKARDEGNAEVTIHYEKPHSDATFATSVAALGELGYTFRVDKTSESWGIRNLNTAYYNVLIITIPPGESTQE